MSKSFVDYQELKEKVSIEQVLGMMSLNLKPTGEQLRGCCPVHQGSNPRDFVVTPDKGLWYCFTCKIGGDMIKLVAIVEDLSQKEAALKIAQYFGTVDTVDSNTVNSRTVHSNIGQEKESQVPPKKKGEGNVVALNPLKYLETEHEAVLAVGITKDTSEAFNAGYAPKGILRGRLAIPIYDEDGVLLAYCGRTVRNQTPTLIFPKGFNPEEVIFNVHNIEEGSVVDFCSDPLDILLSFQSGVENAVCFLTETITPGQLQNLASFLEEKNCELI